MVKYADDEEVIQVVRDNSDSVVEGKTTARYAHKPDAVLTKTDFKVLMELTGTANAEQRAPLDLVMVLDVSGSMRNHDRIEHMKTASKFVVKKLSPIDRLSVVKFSNHAKRLCPLRQMTLAAQSDVEKLIGELKDEYTTNMTEALEEAKLVLNQRRFPDGREVAIMFMSDGAPYPEDKDGRNVNLDNVPVFTFGLGQDTDHKVLENIASRSALGTFSVIEDAKDIKSTNLSNAFSKCLAGLLSVVVKDLTLTITPVKSKSTIVDVSAGRYQPDEIKPDSPVTFSFGNLYSQEIRNILVDLSLEEVDKPKGTDVLEFFFKYKDPITEEPYEALPLIIDVRRTNSASTKENPEVLMELARLNTAAKMREAMVQADGNNFQGAQATVRDAQNDLQNVDVDKTEQKLKALEAELAQFLKYLDSPAIYNELGRSFALAALLSHALQRDAAKGDPSVVPGLYETDAMKNIIEQVKAFVNDPIGYIVPTPAQDAQEIKKANPPPPKPVDPIKEMAKTLSEHLGQAIQALQAIQEILNKSRA